MNDDSSVVLGTLLDLFFNADIYYKHGSRNKNYREQKSLLLRIF